MTSSQSICPPGFDCQSSSTCPSAILTCPDGFFCSSYAGSPYESDLDLRYAMMVNLFTDEVVTNSNKDDFIDRNRTIQTRCLAGFYCPNTTTILVMKSLLDCFLC